MQVCGVVLCASLLLCPFAFFRLVSCGEGGVELLLAAWWWWCRLLQRGVSPPSPPVLTQKCARLPSSCSVLLLCVCVYSSREGIQDPRPKKKRKRHRGPSRSVCVRKKPQHHNSRTQIKICNSLCVLSNPPHTYSTHRHTHTHSYRLLPSTLAWCLPSISYPRSHPHPHTHAHTRFP